MEVKRQFTRVCRFLYRAEFTPGVNSRRYNSFSVLRNEQLWSSRIGFLAPDDISRNYSQSAGLSLKNPGVQKYILKLAEDANAGRFRGSSGLLETVMEIKHRLSDLQELRELARQEDFKDDAARDMENLEGELKKFEEEFFNSVLEPEPLDDNDVMIEITGLGGRREAWFALDLFQMYQNFAVYKDLEFTVAKWEQVETGGLRKGVAIVSGPRAHYYLKFEHGLHRSLWIPTGMRLPAKRRIEAYPATVTILPLPTDIQFFLNPSALKYEAKKRKLTGYLKYTPFASITYLPTGITCVCQREPCHLKNQELALKMLRAQIYNNELIQSQTAKTQQSRKLQKRLGIHSERIRSYHYLEDRVTDHRIGLTVTNLKGVVQGKRYFDDLVTKLHDYDKQERLAQLFSDPHSK